jgi:hypothetical protein
LVEKKGRFVVDESDSAASSPATIVQRRTIIRRTRLISKIERMDFTICQTFSMCTAHFL